MAQIKGDVHSMQADTEWMSEVHTLFDQISARFGRLKIAINNAAGEAGMGKPITGFSESEFDSTIKCQKTTCHGVSIHIDYTCSIA